MSSQTSAASDYTADSDLHRAISGAEDMLNQAAEAGGEKAAELRSRAVAQLQALRERLTLAQDVALETSRRAGRATDVYVHEHPWRVIAAAGVTGLLIGLLLNRR